jgi:hypothetical protein
MSLPHATCCSSWTGHCWPWLPSFMIHLCNVCMMQGRQKGKGRQCILRVPRSLLHARPGSNPHFRGLRDARGDGTAYSISSFLGVGQQMAAFQRIARSSRRVARSRPKDSEIGIGPDKVSKNPVRTYYTQCSRRQTEGLGIFFPLSFPARADLHRHISS